MKLTRSDQVRKDPQWPKIAEAIEDLDRRGILSRLHGECIAAADMLQHELERRGVHSRIVECQLTLINDQQTKTNLRWIFVGWNNTNYGAQGIDTHVVVVTETATPLLIDLSISGYLNTADPWIVEPLNGADSLHLGRYTIGPYTATYTPKRNPRLPGLHQQTLLERLRQQRRTDQKILWLTLLLTVTLIISAINLGRGGYDHYQKYISNDNNWGPNSIEQLQQRIQDMERRLPQSPASGEAAQRSKQKFPGS
jgi:hypothetical protein